MVIFLLLIVSSQGSYESLIPYYGIPPSSRKLAAMVYSDFFDSFIIFGGCDDTVFYNDIWSFQINNHFWSKLLQMTEALPSNNY